jgi:hypothetical protein
VADNLRRVAEAAVPFYREAMPMLAATFGDPNLLMRHRGWMQQKQLGPQRANLVLASYLRGEIELGRLNAKLNADAAAAMLLGACQQRAFFDEFMGRDVDADEIAAFAAAIIDTLMAAAEPRPPAI